MVWFLFDHEREIASRSLYVGFVGSSLLACLVSQAPHPAVMGEDVMGVERDECDDALLEKLQVDIFKAGWAVTVVGNDGVMTSDDERERDDCED